MTTDARMTFEEFEKIAPEARAALSALSKAVGDSGLDRGLTMAYRFTPPVTQSGN